MIVWCATVHAAMSSLPAHPQWKPFGMRLRESLGDRVAAIGFSAIAGRFGRPGQPETELTEPPADSIEHAVRAKLRGATLCYIDRATLAKRRRLSTRAFDYTRFDMLDGASALDGLVVLAEENPLHAALTR